MGGIMIEEHAFDIVMFDSTDIKPPNFIIFDNISERIRCIIKQLTF